MLGAQKAGDTEKRVSIKENKRARQQQESMLGHLSSLVAACETEDTLVHDIKKAMLDIHVHLGQEEMPKQKQE